MPPAFILELEYAAEKGCFDFSSGLDRLGCAMERVCMAAADSFVDMPPLEATSLVRRSDKDVADANVVYS